MTEDDLRQATAGMQTNGISSEKLEDGELDEEPETAQAQPNGDSADTLRVSGQPKRSSYSDAYLPVGAFDKRVRAQATPSQCKYYGGPTGKAMDG